MIKQFFILPVLYLLFPCYNTRITKMKHKRKCPMMNTVLRNLTRFYTFILVVCLNTFFLAGTNAQVDSQPVAATSATDHTFETIDVPGVAFLELTASSDFGDFAGNTRSADGKKMVGFTIFDGEFLRHDFPGSLNTFFYALSNTGMAAGHYQDSNGLYHGVILEDGVLRQYDFPGAVQTQIYGISDSTGALTGNYIDASGVRRGFSGDEMIEFPGAAETYAEFVNAGGGMVGSYVDTDGLFHPYIRTRNGRFVSLDLSRAERLEFYFVHGINDAMVVVSRAKPVDGDTLTYVGTFRDGLQEFKIPGSVSTEGWNINQDGSIVGHYDSVDGRRHGFIATPAPNEPALTVSMKGGVVQLQEILVTPDDDALAQFEKTTDLVLSEGQLDEKMGITIADTLGDEVGVAQRSMGRAVARPVIRGMGGDRLLILEDGERTGDKSASAADHAVAIDPSTAKNIKVIRGPASLIYGSNTLGGVIDVKREIIPQTLPHHPTVDLKFQSESVNSGITATTGLTVPIGDTAWRLAWNRRYADDTRTPVGVLENTSLSNVNFSSGASVVKDWGHAGISGGRYKSDYGIPGSPEGHISGVNVELGRQRYEGNLEYSFNDTFLEKLRFHSTHTRYQHQEFESNKTLGVEFIALTSNVSALAHLSDDAIAGVWSEYRDHSTGGFYWTPHTREISIAGFYFNQRKVSDFTLQGAVRYDLKRVEPFKTGTVTKAGTVQRRNFGGVSGAVSSIYHWTDGLKTGATMMKTFRAPGIEELFSDGPHLAAYSYEIGNSELGTENGWGTEAFLRYSRNRVKLNLAVFSNQIYGYLIPANTGEKEWGSGAAGWLWIYQYTGLDAVLDGAELSVDAEIVPRVYAQVRMSYVRGTLKDSDVPIERIPPFSGKLALRYMTAPLNLHVTARFSDSQNRLGEFEEPTDGYIAYDMGCQYLFSIWGLQQQAVFAIENLLDTEYRQHLSRIKAVMPEPGRNIKFLYRIGY